MVGYGVASWSGSPVSPNEDFAAVAGGTVVVLDGLTARTASGCKHGVSWYVRNLAHGILANSDKGPGIALACGIEYVSRMHASNCDLKHPGTPSAAVAILDLEGAQIEYLVLADVTLVLESQEGIQVITDQRVSASAAPERAEVDALPIGSKEKAGALIRMKEAELRERNTEGGYWVASSDPGVVERGLSGTLSTPSLLQAAVMSDGAARVVDLFGLLDWRELLDALNADGPMKVLKTVRTQESADPSGLKWPRNKQSDDASIVHVSRSYSK